MDEAAPDGPRRRRRTRAFLAVGATVAAVVATLVIPGLLSASAPTGPSVPQPPAPSRKPDVPGTTTWQSIRCLPAEGDDCVAPRQIDHGGAMLYTVGGHRQTVRADAPASHELTVIVPKSRGDRWVLMGAESTGSGSRLSVALGNDAAVTVPPGRLSLFSLPGHSRLVVSVADVGEPREGEELRVQQYASH